MEAIKATATTSSATCKKLTTGSTTSTFSVESKSDEAEDKDLHHLRRAGVAVVCQATGRVVQSDQCFRQLVFSKEEQQKQQSVKLPWLTPSLLAIPTGARSRYFERRFTTLPGRRCCIGVTVSPSATDGQVRLQVSDITARVAAEEELSQLVHCAQQQRDTEQRHRDTVQSLVYSAASPVIGFDREGRITEWNACVAELVGASEEQMLGTPLEDACTATSVPRVRRAVAGFDPLKGECLSLRVVARPQRLDDGDELGKVDDNAADVVDLLVNSTIRVDAVTGMGAGGYVLAREVTDVVRARKAAMLAARNARAERSMLHFMAREMRKPLFAAHAGVHLLQDFVASSAVAALPGAQEAADDAAMAFASLDYVAEQLATLLDLPAVLAGEVPPLKKRANVAQGVLEPALAIQRQRAAPGVRLTSQVEPTGQQLVGELDTLRVQHVLFILVGDAVKRTRDGFVRVVAAPCAARGALSVRVEDSGAKPPSAEAMANAAASCLARGLRGHSEVNLSVHLAGEIVARLGGEMHRDEGFDSGRPGFPGACYCFTVPFAQSASASGSFSKSSSES